MLKSKLRMQDKATQKQVAEVQDALADAEKSAHAIEGGGPTGAGLDSGGVGAASMEAGGGMTASA